MPAPISKLLILVRTTISVGSMLALVPVVTLLYIVRDKVDVGGLLIKLTFVFVGLIVAYLVFKIIIKLIHRDEEEQDIDTMHLVDVALFSGIQTKQILFGLGAVVGILLFSLVPIPWNIFLILAAFYVMFSMLTKLA